MPAFGTWGGRRARARLSALDSTPPELDMKPATIAALALACASAPAFAGSNINGHKCDVHSDWSVRSHRMAFVFSRDGHVPGEVGIGGGRLFIDGREEKLSAADHAR